MKKIINDLSGGLVLDLNELNAKNNVLTDARNIRFVTNGDNQLILQKKDGSSAAAAIEDLNSDAEVVILAAKSYNRVAYILSGSFNKFTGEFITGEIGSYPSPVYPKNLYQPDSTEILNPLLKEVPLPSLNTDININTPELNSLKFFCTLENSVMSFNVYCNEYRHIMFAIKLETVDSEGNLLQDPEIIAEFSDTNIGVLDYHTSKSDLFGMMYRVSLGYKMLGDSNDYIYNNNYVKNIKLTYLPITEVEATTVEDGIFIQWKDPNLYNHTYNIYRTIDDQPEVLLSSGYKRDYTFNSFIDYENNLEGTILYRLAFYHEDLLLGNELISIVVEAPKIDSVIIDFTKLIYTTPHALLHDILIKFSTKYFIFESTSAIINFTYNSQGLPDIFYSVEIPFNDKTVEIIDNKYSLRVPVSNDIYSDKNSVMIGYTSGTASVSIKYRKQIVDLVNNIPFKLNNISSLKITRIDGIDSNGFLILTNNNDNSYDFSVTVFINYEDIISIYTPIITSEFTANIGGFESIEGIKPTLIYSKWKSEGDKFIITGKFIHSSSYDKFSFKVALNFDVIDSYKPYYSNISSAVSFQGFVKKEYIKPEDCKIVNFKLKAHTLNKKESIITEGISSTIDIAIKNTINNALYPSSDKEQKTIRSGSSGIRWKEYTEMRFPRIDNNSYLYDINLTLDKYPFNYDITYKATLTYDIKCLMDIGQEYENMTFINFTKTVFSNILVNKDTIDIITNKDYNIITISPNLRESNNPMCFTQMLPIINYSIKDASGWKDSQQIFSNTVSFQRNISRPTSINNKSSIFGEWKNPIAHIKNFKLTFTGSDGSVIALTDIYTINGAS